MHGLATGFRVRGSAVRRSNPRPPTISTTQQRGALPCRPPSPREGLGEGVPDHPAYPINLCVPATNRPIRGHSRLARQCPAGPLQEMHRCATQRPC